MIADGRESEREEYERLERKEIAAAALYIYSGEKGSISVAAVVRRRGCRSRAKYVCILMYLYTLKRAACKTYPILAG